MHNNLAIAFIFFKKKLANSVNRLISCICHFTLTYFTHNSWGQRYSQEKSMSMSMKKKIKCLQIRWGTRNKTNIFYRCKCVQHVTFNLYTKLYTALSFSFVYELTKNFRFVNIWRSCIHFIFRHGVRDKCVMVAEGLLAVVAHYPFIEFTLRLI